MELGAGDLAAFDGRARQIDYAGVPGLHFLGDYRRDLPVSLTRMMENAFDWEHLPFVHPSSFADIALVEQGSWGWRCMVALPAGAGDQAVELLVDKQKHYWATTVVRGFGEGIQIHTQAADNPGGTGIAIEVRFYLPQSPESEEQGLMILAALRMQYAKLYDEDEALMAARQKALDAKGDKTASLLEPGRDLGFANMMDREAPNLVQSENGDVVVRWHDGGWIAHQAKCPHMLGPLDYGEAEGGSLVCPWHGYRFSLRDGREAEARCPSLKLAKLAQDDDGRLLVARAD